MWAAGCSGSAPDGAEFGGAVDAAAVWEPQQAGLEGFHWVQVFSGEIITPHPYLSDTKQRAGADLTIRISLSTGSCPFRCGRSPGGS